ncbi:MAG: hypothetical protein L0G69_16545 [Brevibacterium sp.]|nr:hypothetical protein [Brevibacterium sp.]
MTSNEQVGATVRALIRRGTEGSLIFGLAGLVDYLDEVPRDFTPVVTADAVRHLSSTRPTLIRAWEAAEQAGLIARESRAYAGQRKTGHIMFTSEFLADIDRILGEAQS